jgi:hypothetical protein
VDSVKHLKKQENLPMKEIDTALKAYMKENNVDKNELLDDMENQSHGYKLAIEASNYIKMFTGTSSFSMKDLENLVKR